MFQTETEARVSTSVRAAEQKLAEHLNQSVRRLRQAAGFEEIASVLCDAAAPFSHGCAVFHVNENAVTGACMCGAGSSSAARFRELRFSAPEAAAFAGAIESRELVVALCSAAEVSPAMIELFGHAPDEKAYVFPLTVDQTTVGLLYAAGVSTGSAALELLAQSATAILEVRQRPRARPAPADLVRIEPSGSQEPRGAAPASPASGAPDWDSLSLQDRNVHLRAQRFARVQVAEMRLYRPGAVKAGRARGDLYSALQDAIDSGREAYRQTFLPASPTMVDYFHQELVRTLANDNPAWLGEKYPGPLV